MLVGSREHFSRLLDLGQRDLALRDFLCGVLRGATYQPRRSPMLKIVMAGTTALFLIASPIANAQSSQTSSAASPERLNAVDRNNLTDMRIDLVKAALQLTPEQEKLWPPVESAIRARAEDRKARVAKIQETVGRRADESRV